MKTSFLILFLLFFFPGERGLSADLEGFFISTRASVDTGAATYQNVSDSLNGWAGEATMGWRLPSLFKIGLTALYENLTLQGGQSAIGPLNMIGYGLQTRLFFVSTVFIELNGGMTQARLTTSSTGNDLVANGTFYTIGPGAEFKINDNLSLELSLRIHNVIFPQNEFLDMRAIFYSTGFTFYFK